MSDTGSGHSQFDLPRIIETTLTGVFWMVGAFVRTTWDFVVRPGRFLPGRDLHDRTHLQPLSFAVLSYAAMFAAFAAAARRPDLLPAFESYPLLTYFNKALEQADYKRLFVALLPYLFAMGLFAWTIAAATKLVQGAITFRISLELFAYCVGAANVMYAVVLPLDAVLSAAATPGAPSVAQIMVRTFIVAFLLRCCYCYLYLLRRAARLTRLAVIAVVLVGMVFFLFLFSIVVGWLAMLFVSPEA